MFRTRVLPLRVVVSGLLAPSAATGVIISEFMAANDSTLTNEFGRYDDWIELHNNGPSTIDLTGLHLTDDANNLTKWTFPSASMSPGSYLVVWASNKDTVINGEIHTSFRLSAGGGYLALVRPDGLMICRKATCAPSARPIHSAAWRRDCREPGLADISLCR
jgi:hypothetical protein